MIYQFTGSVNVFNGRYWRSVDVREKASTLQAATAAAARHGIAEAKRLWKMRRIEAVHVSIERLGQVVPVDTPEENA